jgi:hypothetical protein
VQAEPCGDYGEEPGEAEIEPPDHDEAPASARQHAHRIGVHRRDKAADALGDVEQPETVLRGASDRFAELIASFGLVFFDNKARSSAELRPTTRVRTASLACSIPRNPGQSLMLPGAPVKTALKKRPQTRGLRSNGGNP